MSRSNYSDELDDSDLAMWRGAVLSSIRGRRGQSLLQDLAVALDAMPEKILIADALVNEDGDHCVLGVLGHKRGVSLSDLDPEDSEQVAKTFGIANALACEIVYVNDEAGNYDETPQERWQRVRRWVANYVTVDPTRKAETTSE
jgi:hypothetical protein